MHCPVRTSSWCAGVSEFQHFQPPTPNPEGGWGGGVGREGNKRPGILHFFFFWKRQILRGGDKQALQMPQRFWKEGKRPTPGFIVVKVTSVGRNKTQKNQY